jgi:hypothetical protein
MSSAVISTSAALSRHFVFEQEEADERPLSESHKKPAGTEESVSLNAFPSILNQQSIIDQIGNQKSQIANSILPASRLAIRPAPDMVPSGIPAIDGLTGGFPRGCLTEICGPASSGRTTILLAALAAATRREEYCAVVDSSNALDPHSVAASGVDLDYLLWVRCGENLSPKGSQRKHTSIALRNKTSRVAEHRLEHALRVTDLLLGSGGFGLIVLDLADLPAQAARRIPLTIWFRFRRAIEYTPTILLAIEQHPIAGSCSSLLLQLGVPSTQYPVPGSSRFIDMDWQTTAQGMEPSHAHLLTELQIHAEQIRSRRERKPAQSVMFTAKAAWAG